VLTSRSATALLALRSPARTCAASALFAVASATFVPSAHAQDAGFSSCVGGWRSDNCVILWGPAVDPHIRVVPAPLSEEERGSLLAEDRKWLARCKPLKTRDQYGIVRLRYAAPGCEFGVNED
jgi:hypothetical protein